MSMKHGRIFPAFPEISPRAVKYLKTHYLSCAFGCRVYKGIQAQRTEYPCMPWVRQDRKNKKIQTEVKTMKYKLIAGAVIVICLSLLTFGTLAYFTAEDTAHNVITSGGIDIELLEWADEEKTIPFPENGANGVMPGTEVTKIVEVKNSGSAAAYVRVKVEKEIILQEGVEGEPDSDLIKIDFDETCWIPGEDGYYYYKEVLEPDAVTEPLFALVDFDSGMGNIYQNSIVTIDVKSYAVQAANNGNDVMSARGWPGV